MELIFLPYYLFQVSLRRKGRDQIVKIAIDGLTGHSHLFSGDGLTYLSRVDNPVCLHELHREEALRIVSEEYRGRVLDESVRSKEVTTVKSVTMGEKTFYPFWVGYFEKGDGHDFGAVDAVTGERQGVRMRRMLLKALRQITRVDG
ncbi:MAG: hypothetical protein V3U24_10330 [Candidatus Neomarinimicrobiota bacterium]